MRDQPVSRISGRTRAAVFAMFVRALRITVLKSAGNFTCHECHDLNAEKTRRVKYFMLTRCGICCVPAIFERQRGRLGSKISGCGQACWKDNVVIRSRHSVPIPPIASCPLCTESNGDCVGREGTVGDIASDLQPRKNGGHGSHWFVSAIDRIHA
jgi:hypothetical protein